MTVAMMIIIIALLWLLVETRCLTVRLIRGSLYAINVVDDGGITNGEEPVSKALASTVIGLILFPIVQEIIEELEEEGVIK